MPDPAIPKIGTLDQSLRRSGSGASRSRRFGHAVVADRRAPAAVERYSDMDAFVREIGYGPPRPWHGDLPRRPEHWPITAMRRWETRYEFDLATAALGAPPA